jgi:hypothetical protein
MPSLIHASPTTVVSRGTAMPASGACIRMPCGFIRSANITAWMPYSTTKLAITNTRIRRVMGPALRGA